MGYAVFNARCTYNVCVAHFDQCRSFGVFHKSAFNTHRTQLIGAASIHALIHIYSLLLPGIEPFFFGIVQFAEVVPRDMNNFTHFEKTRIDATLREVF
jgi:hypothetical protein